MTPAGLKDSGILHSLGRLSAQGSSGPGLFKGRPLPVNETPVIPITARLGPNGLLMRLIGRDEYKATVLRSDSGRVLMVCQFPNDLIIDRLVTKATPTIEIEGSDRLSIKCEFLGIMITIGTESSNDIAIRFRPRAAYVLNGGAEPGAIWSAVRCVHVHTGNGTVAIANSKYDPKTSLRRVP